MLNVAFATMLYVFGFVFLYGVIRLGVRHGIEDANARRELVLRAEERALLRERALLTENAYLTNG